MFLSQAEQTLRVEMLKGNTMSLALLLIDLKEGHIDAADVDVEYQRIYTNAIERLEQTHSLEPARSNHPGVAPVQTPAELRIPADGGVEFSQEAV